MRAPQETVSDPGGSATANEQISSVNSPICQCRQTTCDGFLMRKLKEPTQHSTGPPKGRSATVSDLLGYAYE
jgi:hypothetical protein